ncbi:MAG TPA: hypothetical protein VLA34_13525, partial [Candidatus Krumholzibacterium sp.]|nr:hypothetical protein [Candidatus Krumholzibacterium sp.]
GGLGELAGPLMRICWMALVASDALRKLLHITRPREFVPGAADAAFRGSLDSLCRVIEETKSSGMGMARAIAAAMEEAGERFDRVLTDDTSELLLIGVVGEIYCRLDTFSNESLIRELEKFGAMAWLSDISEWVWYTDTERMKNLRSLGRTFSGEMAGALTKRFFQRRYESTILDPIRGRLSLLPEPHDIMEILRCGEPYLPWKGALGEMALSVGKSVYMHGKGVDGIVDISPFTCMNGIVAESVYPRVSRDHDGLPIRSFYFDGTRKDLDSELSVFMELARGYNRRRSVRIGESA